MNQTRMSDLWGDLLIGAALGLLVAALLIERERRHVVEAAYLERLEALEDSLEARAAYEEWKRDPSVARPYGEIRDELVAEGLLEWSEVAAAV
ncbi:MAG: hypothetical protein M3220_21150 [Chloroflexota bacterium]|nr:hypothetical protein [Chloroflexota bacterium]